MQDLTQWGTWSKGRGGTTSSREGSELQGRHCWPVLTGCSSLLPLASWPQNSWVFWELLTSWCLFSIYSKRAPISCRLWGSAGICMINKRIFYLLGMWVFFFAWNVSDCTRSILDCTFLVKRLFIWQSWHQWNLRSLIFDPGRQDLRAQRTHAFKWNWISEKTIHKESSSCNMGKPPSCVIRDVSLRQRFSSRRSSKAFIGKAKFESQRQDNTHCLG